MELKQLNKIIVLIVLVINMNVFSQMKIADIEDKQFSINLKAEKGNIIEILDDDNYSVYYILDRKKFDFDKKYRNVGLVNLIFFSKKHNKGILTLFKQSIDYRKKSVYDISLSTGSADNYMFIPSMIIVDKDFNYEYLMKYSYMHLPHDRNVYTSSISIQDIKNYCNLMHTNIKGNLIYENIDDILSNISKINKNDTAKNCNPIVYDVDLKDFFPKKIIK